MENDLPELVEREEAPPLSPNRLAQIEKYLPELIGQRMALPTPGYASPIGCLTGFNQNGCPRFAVRSDFSRSYTRQWPGTFTYTCYDCTLDLEAALLRQERLRPNLLSQVLPPDLVTYLMRAH